MYDKPCPSLLKLLELPEDQRILGPYRLAHQLGRGGFAPVWLAREIHGTKEFRTVAVKLFCVDPGDVSAAGKEQIVEEARALCQVEHPNIVRFYNFQTDASGDVLGIVMEYARGSSLDRRLQSDGRLPATEVVALGVALASALAEVHRVGLVHRDVKPGNVIEAKGLYKLIDFGIASGAQRSRREAQMTRIILKQIPQDVKGTRLTAFADTLQAHGDRTFGGTTEIPSGTLGYMDPECIAHLSPATATSDLYSLGALLYECLTGMVPAAAAAIVTGGGGLKPEVVDGRERPPPVLDVAPEVPEALAKLVDGLLQPESALRSHSAAQIRDALVRIQSRAHDSLPAPTQASPGVASRSAKRAGGVLAGAVVIATFVAIWFASRAGAPVAVVPSAAPQPATTSIDAGPSAIVSTTETAVPPPVKPLEEPPWGQALAVGQRRLSEGDVKGALEKFLEAQTTGGGPTAHAFVEHVTAATSPPAGPCKLQAFSHPRLGYTTKTATRPSVAAVPDGAVVVWTDDHEQPGHDKAYSVMIDRTGHPTSTTRDVSPEGERIFRPQVMAEGDRVVLLYWDGNVGPFAGVNVRWLSPDGRVAGAPIRIDPGRPVNLWPTLTRAPGGFIVAWQDDRGNHGSDEVFLRRLNADLFPVGVEKQATAVGSVDASARTPSIAHNEDTLLVAYVLSSGGSSSQVLKLRRFPLGSPDAAIETTRREGQPVTIRGDPRVAPDSPQVECGFGKDECFMVWNGKPQGAYAARVDVKNASLYWHKKFAPEGSHPSIGMNGAGEMMLGYFEDGRVKIAALRGDVVGEPSVIGKVTGDHARPWVAPGREHGEWLVAWEDMESGRPEPYVARVVCKE